jgi:hypothetical protein
MKTVEGSGLFPYIAWAVFLGFVLCTFYITLQLQKSAEYLGDKMEENVVMLNSLKK